MDGAMPVAMSIFDEGIALFLASGSWPHKTLAALNTNC
jgi:hypothetical protein